MIVDGQSSQAIATAAQTLQRGELLGLPTETVYGLAADAGNDAAVAKIFAAKGRPADHPLIVHVASVSDVPRFASVVPDFAQRLMDAFWPGPLTLILPRRPDVAAVAAGGQNSVGLRCPSHPVAQAVLQQAQALGVFGVAAPSANLFGRVSPTTAAHVADEFGDGLLIVDGGACEVGIESTIVDCTRGTPVLLRPGVLTTEQLSAVCSVFVRRPAQVNTETDAPRASGTLASHYAPSAQVHLMDAAELQAALNDLNTHKAPARVAIWARQPMRVHPTLSARVVRDAMPQDPVACAHALFAQLREFDRQGVEQIWIERPAQLPEWEGVLDRLTRAATPAG